MLPYESVRTRLAAYDADLGHAFWEAVRPNLVRLSDVVELKKLVEGPIEPVREDPEFLTGAAALLPVGDLSSETWTAWTKALSMASGRKGKALYHPLRLALTGREHGPELAKLLPLIGRERALARLKGETA
jgi:glutamyl-tRNA synthetase